MRSFILCSILLLGLGYQGCSQNPQEHSIGRPGFTLLPDILGDQVNFLNDDAPHTPLSAVLVFENTVVARQSIDEFHRLHLNTEVVASNEKIVKLSLSGNKLSSIWIPSGTLATLNSPLQFKKPQASLMGDSQRLITRDSHTSVGTSRETDELLNMSNSERIQSLLAARAVVGVDALRKRFPTADGRSIKVAVFDSGVDFGVPGLFKTPSGDQKLLGFYDFTGFGRVETTVLTSDIPEKIYKTGALTLEVGDKIGARSIQAVGLLDEKKLANAYMATDGVDLDSNQDATDVFPFLVGINSEGLPAVWFDSNRDGKISSRAFEEITDFNSTYRYIDLRKDVAPSGARPLAVTIRSLTDVQFHSVLSGHGTSCSLIVAGDQYADGKLEGMAPKAKILAYVLDSVGQDIYRMDQLVYMFEHAKSQGVDAISISWGFSTADLNSARFLADYLDREIASSGIIIGISAGNNGPGILSATPDDYIPHHGFGVGAMISRVQAENVFGWTGPVEDSVVWYSSVGPTRGGRQVPDVVSPLMTWVRGARGVSGPQFYAFSGTSSAAPALVGAISALVSQLKQEGYKINPRLLKLAIQNSAKKLPKVEQIRQGAGLIDVNGAYDWYIKLAKEMDLATADLSRSQPFAYELRASLPLAESNLMGEGLHLVGTPSPVTIQVNFTPETLALMDPLKSFEPMLLSHESSFLDISDLIPLQASGAKMTVSFKTNQMTKVGVYSDFIHIRRPSDGLVLLTIPVVVEIPIHLSRSETILNLDYEIAPFDILRFPLHLERSSSLRLDALAREVDEGQSTFLGMTIRNSTGETSYETRIPLLTGFEPLRLGTPEMPPGAYEMILFRDFRKPATLNKVHLFGALRSSMVEILSSKQTDRTVTIIARAGDDIDLASAKLKLQGQKFSMSLKRVQTVNNGTPAFEGEFTLPYLSPTMEVGVHQNLSERILEPLLHMTWAMTLEKGDILYRGWMPVDKPGMPLHSIELGLFALHMHLTQVES